MSCLLCSHIFGGKIKEVKPGQLSEVSQDPAFINLLQESGESRILTVSLIIIIIIKRLLKGKFTKSVYGIQYLVKQRHFGKKEKKIVDQFQSSISAN